MDDVTGFQALIDLFQTIIKLMSREVVVRQVIALVIGLVVAALLSRILSGWVNKIQDAVRDRYLLLDSSEHTASDIYEPIDNASRNLKWYGRFLLLLLSTLDEVLFPILALIALHLLVVVFGSFGWFVGLITNTINILWWFLLYRFIIGILDAVGNSEKVQFYNKRLFLPVFVLIALGYILSDFTNISQLGQARLFNLGQSPITLGSFFLVLLGLPLWFIATGAIADSIGWFLTRSPDRSPGTVQGTLTLLRYFLIIIGLVVAFGVLGLDATTIAAITGGLSIGVGFALQDVLKNFLGGLIVLTEGSVRPGDWVEIGGTEGEVDKLSIRATIIRTFDNVEYIVPNQNWLTSTVTTYTRNNRRARARIPMGVSYDADPKVVQKLMVETALRHPLVLPDPSPAAPLVNYGDSSVDFIILAWVEDAKDRGKVASEVRLMLWDVLKENGIEIPYPQRDLHIRSGLSALLPGGAAGGKD